MRENFSISIDGNDYVFCCDVKDTRNGFKHTCTVLKNYEIVLETKICYLNRTWESYTYQSILQKCFSKLGLDFKTYESQLKKY